ncbi:MAG: 2-hydroxyacyl-CoA dehydratase, partial [Clostridia bacterium]|nr:2-hydroxyacyl-CoA dehydratase [Clostridia bacterium]
MNYLKEGTPVTYLGIDIGSTTAKLVVVRNGEVIYRKYERHLSQVRQKTLELLSVASDIIGKGPVKLAVSGSAGLGLANAAGFPFVQEVFATGEVVRALAPYVDTVIELGGEDAKVIFFRGTTDERMNGSCAGGTGAFIDQMATLLGVTVDELDRLSLNSERTYPIASRCGVFAKTDIQPLLNQGARKEDIAQSIYQAVVNQTIAGLAQGRKIEGNVMLLGGPLYFCRGLRECFIKTLKLKEENVHFPEYALYSVALGAALNAERSSESTDLSKIIVALENSVEQRTNTNSIPPLFENVDELEAFRERHARADVPEADISEYSGKAWLGIDCGSTTTKLVLIDEQGRLLYKYYSSNKGDPVDVVRSQLLHIYSLVGDRITIAGSASTGYGEELICAGFGVDRGLVETIAHYTAASHFDPNVDFILDIGGQDIKCFRIKNKSIDSIMLNEACSSGCGSFLETFAKSMGYSASEFAALGLFGKSPVDLGSRCTVFMNSSVKQAQKDGAEVEDISAGLSISVVKNAIYKVIRAGSADELGDNIVVQGGTFYNDAVLRSFEKELGKNVTRPAIAGLMGAYGAALYVKGLGIRESSLISREELLNFEHTAVSVRCNRCENRCPLTVNTFSGKGRFISGNQCDKGAGVKDSKVDSLPNLHRYKRDKLFGLASDMGESDKGTIGLPLALGMYELAPLWHKIFRELGFRVLMTGQSSKEIYAKGHFSIPSDTACYPAKLMHGHIQLLIEEGVDAIFYPCLTYNIDEKDSDNHYNCPVVAYYSELLQGNTEELSSVKFLYPYLNINDEKQLAKGLYKYLSERFGWIKASAVRSAVKAGMEAYDAWMKDIRNKGREALRFAEDKKIPVMVLAGRPYHTDSEIGHGIDRLANSLGFAVVSEDSISDLAACPGVGVLNQWTYHSRLYKAAEYVSKHNNCQLVQLVSFGCGIDAITTDEVRSIIESQGGLYTQLKIDEITNLGAVKIRLRSL